MIEEQSKESKEET